MPGRLVQHEAAVDALLDEEEATAALDDRRCGDVNCRKTCGSSGCRRLSSGVIHYR